MTPDPQAGGSAKPSRSPAAAPAPALVLRVDGHAAVGPFACRVELDPDAPDLMRRAVVRIVDARGLVVRELRPTALEAADDATVAELVGRARVERDRLDAAWVALRADASPLARPAEPRRRRRRPSPRIRELGTEPQAPRWEPPPAVELATYILMLLGFAASIAVRSSYHPWSGAGLRTISRPGSFDAIEPLKWDRPEWRAFLREAHTGIEARARRGDAPARGADRRDGERYATPEELGLTAPAGTVLEASRTPRGFVLVLRPARTAEASADVPGEEVLCGVRGGDLPPRAAPGTTRPELPYAVARSAPGAVVCWPATW